MGGGEPSKGLYVREEEMDNSGGKAVTSASPEQNPKGTER